VSSSPSELPCRSKAKRPRWGLPLGFTSHFYHPPRENQPLFTTSVTPFRGSPAGPCTRSRRMNTPKTLSKKFGSVLHLSYINII
jgi:hypothetical protein